MKKIIFIAASVLFCVFSLVLSSCSDDDDAKQSVAKSVVALAEVGKENSKEAIAGKDLHLEGDLVADGLIARIDVTIAAKDGNKTIVKQSYTEGKYIGVRNTTFHEHLDIPADAAPGAYTVTFVVTDKLGQSTTFTSDLTVKALDKTVPTITFKEVGEGPPVDARNRDMHPDPVRAEKAQRPEQLCTQFRRTGKVIRTTKSHESPTLPLPVL